MTPQLNNQTTAPGLAPAIAAPRAGTGTRGSPGTDAATDPAQGAVAATMDFATLLGRIMPAPLAPAQSAVTAATTTGGDEQAAAVKASAIDEASAALALGTDPAVTASLPHRTPGFPAEAARPVGDKSDDTRQDGTISDAAPVAPLVAMFIPSGQTPAPAGTAPAGRTEATPALSTGAAPAAQPAPAATPMPASTTMLAPIPAAPGAAARTGALPAFPAEAGKPQASTKAESASAGTPVATPLQSASAFAAATSAAQNAAAVPPAAGEKTMTPQPDAPTQFVPDRAVQQLSVQAQPAAATPVAAPAVPGIGTPLGTSGWDSQLGQRVVWVSHQQMRSAEISINPPELGPVELRITLDNQQGGQQATVHFASPHPEVRDALENALPRLREIMADAGIALGNASVGSESFRDPAATGQQREPANYAASVDSAAAQPDARAAASIPVIRQGSGLVDTFA